MEKRQLTELCDERLVVRGNKILDDLFRKGCHSIRQLTATDAEAKGFYRFLQNDRITEDEIVKNLTANCRHAAKGKHVVCIQDTTEINLSAHSGRINKDSGIGTTNANNKMGLGFFLHPCLVVDAVACIPYGFAAVKVWNRPLEFKSKHDRQYSKLPIEEKESFKWIEVSTNTKTALKDTVESMVIVQDREGDIYEQFALVPDDKTDLLVRARTNRTLTDKTKLFNCLGQQPCQDVYQVVVEGKQKRKARVANIEVRFKEVTISKTDGSSRSVPRTITLSLIEAKEGDYDGKDAICWRLLTTIGITNIELARMCIEWYSWRWTIEEVFKILKKEGFDIEASELEYASSVRKMCLLTMEVIIKLFLMRLAYAEPELEFDAGSCFSEGEQEFMEHQILRLEGKTEKQKCPFKEKGKLKRYAWVIARMGGWKGYESRPHAGITTLWMGLQYFKAAFDGWRTFKDVSTR